MCSTAKKDPFSRICIPIYLRPSPWILSYFCLGKEKLAAWGYIYQGCDLSGFFLISGFFVTKISAILLIFSLILCVLAQFYAIFQDFFYYFQDFSWKANHTPDLSIYQQVVYIPTGCTIQISYPFIVDKSSSTQFNTSFMIGTGSQRKLTETIIKVPQLCVSSKFISIMYSLLWQNFSIVKNGFDLQFAFKITHVQIFFVSQLQCTETVLEHILLQFLTGYVGLIMIQYRWGYRKLEYRWGYFKGMGTAAASTVAGVLCMQ